MEKKEVIKAYTAWAAVCFFWGTTYLAIRIGVKTVPPALFAGIRFAIAGLIFLVYLRWRGYSLPNKREILDMGIIGICLLVIANGLVVWAEQWVPSGLAALVVATLPFWIAGFEAAMPVGGTLTVRKTLGIVIGFIGLIVLFAPELKGSFERAYLQGLLALLIAPCSWGAGSLYAKYRPIGCHSLMSAAFQMIIAGGILMGIGLTLGEFHRLSFDWVGFAAIGYLVIFGSIIGYGSYIYALAKLPASKATMYAYVNPVIAVLLGWLILDEPLGWNVASATVMVLFGVVLVNTAKSSP